METIGQRIRRLRLGWKAQKTLVFTCIVFLNR